MQEFRSRDDGSHYPLKKGGKQVYPTEKRGVIVKDTVRCPWCGQEHNVFQEHKCPEPKKSTGNTYVDATIEARKYYIEGAHVNIQDKRRLDFCLNEAKKDKRWAKQKEHDEKWKKQASKISVDMLNERLEKSAELLATQKYAYWKMRAMAKGTVWGREAPIDQVALNSWDSVGKTGKLPKGYKHIHGRN